MSVHLPRRESRPRPVTRKHAARLHRLAAAAAALIGGLLTSAAIIPAASAGIIVPDPGGAAAPVPATTVRVTSGGMAGWQITLIAVGAALIAAAVAVLLDRALAARRAASATSA
jgi:hypothetical protein